MDAAGPLALVVLGIIIGWFIELVIDFLILRPHWMARGRELAESLTEEEVRSALANIEAMRAEQNAALAHLNAHLAEQSARAPLDDATLRDAAKDVAVTLERQLKASSAALLEKMRALVTEEAVLTPDRLTDIKGIGPTFANRLHEVGVYSFRQLAALSPEEIRSMMTMRGGSLIDADSWIEQAKLFVSGRLKAKAEAEETS